MAKHPADKVRKNSEMAEIVIEHHFGVRPKNISFLSTGLTNFVFEVTVPGGEFIVRISTSAKKINYFHKEQWAVAQAKKAGVPVAEILEVGNDVVHMPYMIQKKLNGQEATFHPDRLKIIQQMGVYTALINSIPTTNFGHVFDWSRNRLSKYATWKDYLHKEINVLERLQILERNNMLTSKYITRIKSEIKNMEAWNKKPVLNHGDIRLKNVIINDSAKIIAIIDWEDCTSNPAPYWDLSIALHDLGIDEKQEFLSGYGINEKDFSKISTSLKVLNILHYAPHIEIMASKNEKQKLGHYRLRLNGDLDLYSI